MSAYAKASNDKQEAKRDTERSTVMSVTKTNHDESMVNSKLTTKRVTLNAS